MRYGPSFYSVYNVFDAFLNNNTYYALIALGMTFVIISGGIDLSVGSVAVLAAVAAAQLSAYGLWIAVAGAVLIGLVAGLINGGLIARFALQPFVVTLAMLLAARGAALTLSNNAPVMVDFAQGFPQLGTIHIGPLPLPVVITGVLYMSPPFCSIELALVDMCSPLAAMRKRHGWQGSRSDALWLWSMG